MSETQKNNAIETMQETIKENNNNADTQTVYYNNQPTDKNTNNMMLYAILFISLISLGFSIYNFMAIKNNKFDIIAIDSQRVLKSLYEIGSKEGAEKMTVKLNKLENEVRNYNGVVIDKNIFLNGDKYDKTDKLLSEGTLK